MTGKITKLEVQKNNNKRVNVFVDSQYEFSCDGELVYKFNLKVNSIIELEKIKEIVEEDNYIKAKNDSLRFLERGYKTKKQVVQKLILKGYEEDVIKKVVNFLESYDFINDENYAKRYIHDKQESAGKNKIRYELLKKGIDEEVIKSNLITVKADEEQNAKELAEKKFALLSTREEDKRKLFQKLSRYLMSKGFEWDIVKKVVGEMLKEDID